MQAYGKKKRGSGKLHPHNECGVCSEQNVIKNKERRNNKVVKPHEHMRIDDDSLDRENN